MAKINKKLYDDLDIKPESKYDLFYYDTSDKLYSSISKEMQSKWNNEFSVKTFLMLRTSWFSLNEEHCIENNVRIADYVSSTFNRDKLLEHCNDFVHMNKTANSFFKNTGNFMFLCDAYFDIEKQRFLPLDLLNKNEDAKIDHVNVMMWRYSEVFDDILTTQESLEAPEDKLWRFGTAPKEKHPFLR